MSKTEEPIANSVADTIFRQHKFRPFSSLSADVWHDDRSAGSYEWWYFDALSEDRRMCLVVIFFSGFIFSPRYNRAVADWRRNPRGKSEPQPTDFPAVAATLYRDGRVAWRAIQEYTAQDFAAARDTVSCRIGNNRLLLETERTRRRFFVTLNLPLRNNLELQANLHWELPENFETTDQSAPATTAHPTATDAHEWNLVAPRCNVSGSFRTYHHGTHQIEAQQFSGTGYHDHNRDTRWLPATVAEWQWGRAHFADDLTAVFYRYREHGQTFAATKLFLAHDGGLLAYDAEYLPEKYGRDKFGLRYAARVNLNSAAHPSPSRANFPASFSADSVQPARLEIMERKILDSSFFYLRFQDRARLILADGKIYEAVAVSEELAPRALLQRKLDWLVNMRIGRNGEPAFLK